MGIEITGRCHFCRRRAYDFGNGLRVVCKRHKNKKLNVSFHVAPYVVMAAAQRKWEEENVCNCGHMTNEHYLNEVAGYVGKCAIPDCHCHFWRRTKGIAV